MSIENAREHLKSWGRDGDIIELGESSATVELAARALGVEEARIAKTLSLHVEERFVLIVTAGDVKIDNKKYRDRFSAKARMISPDQVNERIGHEVGGVCPFGIRDAVEVYLDESLRRFETVYPACGSHNSAIELTCADLERISRAVGWVDVCRAKDEISA